MKYAFVAVVLFGFVGHAVADNDADRYKLAVADLNSKLKHPAPGPGLEKAHAAPAAWCGGFAKESSPYDPGRAGRSYNEFLTHGYWTSVLETAAYNCNADPRDAQINAFNAELVQDWINVTGQSEKEAIASIAIRIKKDAMAAGKEKLCSALVIDDETGGEDAIVVNARRALFGCGNNSNELEGLWSDGKLDGDVQGALDQASNDPGELVRVAYIIERTKAKDQLPFYGIDSIDFRLFSEDKARKELAAAPYAGNAYAQAIGSESLGRVRMEIAEGDAAAQAKQKDAEWNELLFAAPKRGADAYTAEAAKFSAELGRSNEFERKAFGPSKKAVAGCNGPLRKDLLTAWRSVPHKTAQEAKDGVSDPVVSLLFTRYVACMAVDGDPMYAHHLQRIQAEARPGRGVRAAAYYAVLEALGKIRADREKFPVKPDIFRYFVGTNEHLHEYATNAASKREKEHHDAMGFVGDGGKGVVKTAAKSGDGVLLTFVAAKHQEMGSACVDTGRLHSIDSSGGLHYFQSCRDTGLFWVNDTPAPVTIPAEFAEGIKPGTFVEFEATRGSSPKDRWGNPIAVYADKGKTKLVNWNGFGF